jgi:hypothetical protein
LYKEYLKCSPTISESTLQGKVHCIIQDIGLYIVKVAYARGKDARKMLK